MDISITVSSHAKGRIFFICQNSFNIAEKCKFFSAYRFCYGPCRIISIDIINDVIVGGETFGYLGEGYAPFLVFAQCRFGSHGIMYILVADHEMVPVLGKHDHKAEESGLDSQHDPVFV